MFLWFEISSKWMGRFCVEHNIIRSITKLWQLIAIPTARFYCDKESILWYGPDPGKYYKTHNCTDPETKNYFVAM